MLPTTTPKSPVITLWCLVVCLVVAPIAWLHSWSVWWTAWNVWRRPRLDQVVLSVTVHRLPHLQPRPRPPSVCLLACLAPTPCLPTSPVVHVVSLLLRLVLLTVPL